MSLFSKIKGAVNKFHRKSINRKLKNRLQNHGMSVLSSNCVGAFILHDLNEPFNSPFVNLYVKPRNFIRYLQNMPHYHQQTLVFKPADKPYPVGWLDDIPIHFMHYHSAQEAQEKWESRLKRLDSDNLFIVMTNKDGAEGVTYQDLADFDNLPFKNKVVFTHKPYPELESAVYIKGFENETQVGDIFEFSGWNGEKYYDQFDYVAWFNKR
ncbi:bicyclomycin/multidrug efflux system [Aggregatibacter actinomycetemcomitans serotype e str. SC1083]|uniref:Bicyclomycin/multidrug efflux system n=1 Tax=Aggregatibacter actinomycetemcomitans serotype e str. SC1083 TaxID=907488 RepID=G4AAH4_AGGAC|nr:DUF1919 domain-containing protein [Aggregatibacter actinomycetemcomitans]EGY32831.1 bicyclomycin/multidrug efflux system [Aggregatibacter actinomycetemcomitans serotype e str. SC1083]KYK72328.1 exopolysaccharide biosynthesis protein [Aggregatibacter actinomycetemcomitans serotype e str. SA3096]KYK80087.1 exopolysaccharide biosynthesis protein [Aggregatibacter actinomycetemcomitans serotype e str. SC936]KYK95469.1 exopolysaccharide biosynthesis protein [Aggregatibacter actinomycetemcomitans s